MNPSTPLCEGRTHSLKDSVEGPRRGPCRDIKRAQQQPLIITHIPRSLKVLKVLKQKVVKARGRRGAALLMTSAGLLPHAGKSMGNLEGGEVDGSTRVRGAGACRPPRLPTAYRYGLSPGLSRLGRRAALCWLSDSVSLCVLSLARRLPPGELINTATIINENC